MSLWLVALWGCDGKEELITATPGSPTGEEPETTPIPEEESDCVVQTLGPSGGTISADGVQVAFPADAIGAEHEVSLCPVDSVDGYTLHSQAWEVQGAELSGAFTVTLEHDGAAGLSLFVPGPDFEPQRNLEQDEALAGPMYRWGTFFVAEDPRLQVRYEVGGVMDLLFVVDSSCSMADQQAQLASAFPETLEQLLNLQVDYHVGVVSMDLQAPQHQGKLREVAGARWLDPLTADPEAVFSEMVQMGSTGSALEAGLGATYLALELEAEQYNLGFLREDTELAVVVMSDEDDLTAPGVVTPQEVIDWLLEQEAARPGVSFHSLVDPGAGARYLGVTAAVGGYTQDITQPSWAGFFEQIVAEVGEPFVFEPAAAQLPEAWVDPISGEEPYRLPDTSVIFDPVAQTAAVVDAQVEPGDVIWLLYLP